MTHRNADTDRMHIGQKKSCIRGQKQKNKEKKLKKQRQK